MWRDLGSRRITARRSPHSKSAFSCQALLSASPSPTVVHFRILRCNGAGNLAGVFLLFVAEKSTSQERYTVNDIKMSDNFQVAASSNESHKYNDANLSLKQLQMLLL